MTIRDHREFPSLEAVIEHQALIEGRPVRAEGGEPTKIQYLVGDATKPIDDGTHERFILHVCNDVGAWGRGFTSALSRLSPRPEESYRHAIKNTKPNSLGAVSLVKVTPELFVANMIAQRGLRTAARPVVIDYEKLEQCLTAVTKIAVDWRASAHMPRIGCGLGGGDWHTVEAIIERTLCAGGVPVFVYDLPPNKSDN